MIYSYLLFLWYVRLDRTGVNKEHSGLTYQILNANGLQMLRGNLKGGETEINISTLQRGLYIIQWQESHTGLRHSAVFYNTL